MVANLVYACGKVLLRKLFDSLRNNHISIGHVKKKEHGVQPLLKETRILNVG